MVSTLSARKASRTAWEPVNSFATTADAAGDLDFGVVGGVAVALLIYVIFYNSSVTHPSAAVFTCRAYLNRIPFVAFGGGCFHPAFLLASSSELILSVI